MCPRCRFRPRCRRRGLRSGPRPRSAAARAVAASPAAGALGFGRARRFPRFAAAGSGPCLGFDPAAGAAARNRPAARNAAKRNIRHLCDANLMKYKQLRKGVPHENLKLWQQNNTFRYYNTTYRIRLLYGFSLTLSHWCGVCPRASEQALELSHEDLFGESQGNREKVGAHRCRTD